MGEALILAAAVGEALRTEAEGTAPFECCGLIGGRDAHGILAVSVRNAMAAEEGRYEMDPAEMWEARSLIRDKDLDLIAFYHSHPRTSPFPSALDLRRAYYPDAFYVIVGLVPAIEIRAFRIVNGLAREIVVHVDAY